MSNWQIQTQNLTPAVGILYSQGISYSTIVSVRKVGSIQRESINPTLYIHIDSPEMDIICYNPMHIPSTLILNSPLETMVLCRESPHHWDHSGDGIRRISMPTAWPDSSSASRFLQLRRKKTLMRVLGTYDVNIATRNALALRRQLHRFLYAYIYTVKTSCYFILWQNNAKHRGTWWHGQPFIIPRFYMILHQHLLKFLKDLQPSYAHQPLSWDCGSASRLSHCLGTVQGLVEDIWD